MFNTKWLITGVFSAAFLTLPFWGSDYVLLFGIFFFFYLGLAQMWNLLVGFSGLLSLGQQAFIGVSGYALAVLTDYYGMNLWLAVFTGGLFSVLLALFMSLFIFRMKGIYFAIGTWIFAEMLMIWFSNWEYVKYGTGMFVQAEPVPDMSTIYYVAFGISAAGFALVYLILSSRIGLGLMAMRDDEEAAETIGISIFVSKLFCFLVAAFITGLIAGVLYVFQVFVEPYKAFSIDWTIILLFIVVIGGIGTIEGPVIGAFIYVFLSQWLSEYTHISMILMGAAAILIILLAPSGIVGTIKERTGFSLVHPRAG